MILDQFKDSKVLITGHTGFKGSWLSAWLNSIGADIYGISISEVSKPSHFSVLKLEKNICHRLLDIRDFDALNEAINSVQPDFVFHLAAQSLVKESYKSPLETFSTNSLGTAHVLETLRNLEKECSLVLITSDKCYENKEWIWGYKETDRLGGKDPYSASKAAAENIIYAYLNSFFDNSNIRIGVGRAGNVIGGGDWAENRIVPDCVKAWSNNETVQIRNPSSTRPWQHVLEPLSGYLTLALQLQDRKEKSPCGEAFNFGPPADHNYSVSYLLEQMSKHWSQAKWHDISNNTKQPYEAGLLKLNCDKAKQYLSWEPTLNFEETVKFTIDWYRRYYTGQSNMTDVTLSQIEAYTNLAQDRMIQWAT